ncbi:hypothetical protein C6P46_003337 [Rhodotorula mucilaginosa]|uniref:Aminopeptidase P N-terminal domain-containing protein n=1 Tax=Rhodotorula mucilaginosa TaxID=5537 RepID=A0A9P7B6C1_RHOMI|nr:hypothetical protein C6P46_003337 [Rhodotorula mucilaginosa]TKA54132.1 hypothetical protein B0A53_03509 [Rhodotorula sp. CCFEE 5036]
MSAYPLVHSHLLVKRLLSLNKPKSLAPALHYVYMVGETVQCRHDTDRELPFRQESNFAWLSGCDVPGSALTIAYEHDGGAEIDPAKVHTTLWLPEIDDAEVMWCGLPPAPEELAKSLHLTSIQNGWTPAALYPPKPHDSALPTIIHTLPTTRPPTSVMASINGPTHSTDYLLKALHEARRNKTPKEVELLRKASEITGGAHRELMRQVGLKSLKSEFEAEADFVSYCIKHGAKNQAYTPIMGAGTSAGTLHYIANDRTFPIGPTLLLVDAGAEYHNYCADVTRCIPLGNGGKFTKECREIYEIVLEMQLKAFEMIKPGADWEAIQRLMHDVLARGLLRIGLFKAGPLGSASEDEVVAKLISEGLTSAFYPHGVGHLLGLDVHDVGGLPEGRSSEPLLKYLRLRVPLEEGFVVTVEPGCYFNEHLFAPHVNSEFVDHALLAKYKYVGGVRIEDNLLVTKNGYDNLTPSWLPKTVADIEALTTGQSS